MEILDTGPFYHGTRVNLKIGDLLTAGFSSNYRPEVIMNRIYFTALVKRDRIEVRRHCGSSER